MESRTRNLSGLATGSSLVRSRQQPTLDLAWWGVVVAAWTLLGACASAQGDRDAGAGVLQDSGIAVDSACGTAFAGSAELCNDLDDDCDGSADEGENGCGGVCPLPAAPASACDGADGDTCTDDLVTCAGANSVICTLGPDDTRTAIHRSYHPGTGEHFYTGGAQEAACCGFVVETADYFFLYTMALGPDQVPFYRCYGTGSGKHFYTTSPACEGVPAVFEGALGLIATSPATGTTPLYRLARPANGDHLYTVSAAEASSAVSVHGYVDEGIAGHVWASMCP